MQQLGNQSENSLGQSPEVASIEAQGLQANSENLGEDAILSSPISNGYDGYSGEIRLSGMSGDAGDGVLDWLKGLLSDQKNESQDGDAIAAGQVEKLLGNANVTRDGEKMALLLGDDVFAEDVIATGANSSIGIIFIDGMEFSLGNDAKLRIDEFVFDQAQSSGEQSLSAIKGAFSYQSGLLAQADPSAVTIKTALGTLGIRGTKLLGLSDLPEGTCVITLLEGEIEVLRDKGGDSIILDEPFETARMKVEWDYIDKSQLSREEALDTFSRLFGGDEGELQEFMGGKSSSLETPVPYSLYESSEYSMLPPIAQGDG